MTTQRSDSTTQPLERRDDAARVRRDSFSMALTACRYELESRLDGHWTHATFHGPISALAALAHRHEIPPQRVLAVVKDMVLQLVHLERIRTTEKNEIMQVVVKMAIDAYYAGTKP